MERLSKEELKHPLDFLTLLAEHTFLGNISFKLLMVDFDES